MTDNAERLLSRLVERAQAASQAIGVMLEVVR